MSGGCPVSATAGLSCCRRVSVPVPVPGSGSSPQPLNGDRLVEALLHCQSPALSSRCDLPRALPSPFSTPTPPGLGAMPVTVLSPSRPPPRALPSRPLPCASPPRPTASLRCCGNSCARVLAGAEKARTVLEQLQGLSRRGESLNTEATGCTCSALHFLLHPHQSGFYCPLYVLIGLFFFFSSRPSCPRSGSDSERQEVYSLFFLGGLAASFSLNE